MQEHETNRQEKGQGQSRESDVAKRQHAVREEELRKHTRKKRKAETASKSEIKTEAVTEEIRIL